MATKLLDETNLKGGGASFQHDGIAMICCEKGELNLQMSPDAGATWFDVDHQQHTKIHIQASTDQALAVLLLPAFDYRLNAESSTSTGAVWIS